MKSVFVIFVTTFTFVTSPQRRIKICTTTVMFRITSGLSMDNKLIKHLIKPDYKEYEKHFERAQQTIRTFVYFQRTCEQKKVFHWKI